MKSFKVGKNISNVSVVRISPFGIWLLVNGEEFFLKYEDYPYFKNQKVRSIKNVKISNGSHLYWPSLDVDLTVDNLKNPSKYPLKYN